MVRSLVSTMVLFTPTDFFMVTFALNSHLERIMKVNALSNS